MFMKKAPDVIDPKTHPQLACLQALIHDEDLTPEGKGDENVMVHWFDYRFIRMITICFSSLQKKQPVEKMKGTNISTRKTIKRQCWHTLPVWKSSVTTKSSTLFYSPIELLHSIILVWLFF